METNESYVRKLIEENLRIDERGFDQLREISVQTNVIKTAEGSATVMWGNTNVLVGVKLSVGTPYPDSPNDGVLIVNAELVPIASPEFEPGPPDAYSVELARVVDRGIRESHAINLEKLYIEKDKVWMVNIDIHVLDHDGNLIDASALGAIAALLTAKIPKYENEKINYGEHTIELPVNRRPIAVTVAKVSNKLITDANLDEENAMDARITITTTEDKNICSIQKGGKGYFTMHELEKAADLAILKGQELRDLL